LRKIECLFNEKMSLIVCRRCKLAIAADVYYEGVVFFFGGRPPAPPLNIIFPDIQPPDADRPPHKIWRRRGADFVRKDCGIGLPFEWVPAHLRELHGMKATLEQAKRFLGLERNAMTVPEARDWILSVCDSRAVQNIPIIKGYACNECQYSAAKMKVMTNHFSKDHKGLKASEHSAECKVQLMFKGGLQKYIQVEEHDEMDIDSKGDSE
jgi:hypothetical protein